MYIVGVVLIIASLCGSSHGGCSTDIHSPRSRQIENGIEVNEPVVIACWCNGPSDSGAWYLNGSRIKSSNDSIPYQYYYTDIDNRGHVLVVPNFLPQYVGNYTCASGNDRMKSIVIELIISQQLFTPPTRVLTEGVTKDFSITVMWSAPNTNSSHLSHYKITLMWTQVVVFPDNHNQQSTLSHTEIECVENNVNRNDYEQEFTNIPAYSHNCLKVEAVYSYNDTVLGTRAALTQCFNSSSSAPSEPVGFHLVQLGHTFLKVQWNSPIFPNGPITHYIMYVDGNSLSISVSELQSPYTYTLGGLEKNTTYDISMSAITNSTKEGPKSESISITTLSSDSVLLRITVVFDTLQDCRKIMESNQSYEETYMKIHDKIIEDIKQWCSCVITVGLSYDTELKCSPGNDNLIIFETKAYASNDTITLLEQSILNNASPNIITVNGNTLEFTDICTDRTRSTMTCVEEYVPPPIITNGTVPKHDDSTKTKTKTIVGVVIAILIIILLAITAAVILITIYYKKRHSYQLSGKSTESQVTGISISNRRSESRLSRYLPAMFSTWRSSNNYQTAPRPTLRKDSIEEPLRDDYSFPLPLADKEATLKDSEIAGNKAITGILQCIDEEKVDTNEIADYDKLDESKVLKNNDVKSEVDDVKSEVKNKVDSCSVTKSDDKKATQTTKQKQNNTNPIPISKEQLTTTYSIPVDFKWDDKTHKQNRLSVNDEPATDQKHLSPIYIEMDDVVCKDEESENGSDDLYSVPIDYINDNNKHICTITRDTQVVKTSTSLPITTDLATDTMKSNCKPQGVACDANSLHVADDNIYSTPYDDDINSNTPSCEDFDMQVYSSVNSPVPICQNPSYKRVQSDNSDPSITEYSDPVKFVNKKDKCYANTPLAAAVANIQSTKKHKPVKPNPYKSRSTASTPRKEDPPLYEEVFQTAATLPYINGVHHNNKLPGVSSLSKTHKASKSQEHLLPTGLDDYTIPSTDRIKIQKNPSYGDVCNASDAEFDYSYVSTNKLITPNVIEDACTTHTEC